VIGKTLFFFPLLELEYLYSFRDGPDQPPSHFDSPGGSSYFHGGGGFHPNFPPNAHPSAGTAADQFNK
jgi:hypothetical protein